MSERRGSYAGAEWVERGLNVALSPLGRAVADLLGELYLGIYHLPTSALRRVKWSDDHYIAVTVASSDLSTYDSNQLTRLVLLAHHCCLRLSVSPGGPNRLKLEFWQRKRAGEGVSIYETHPTIDEAVASFRRYVTLPEFGAPVESKAP